MAGKKGKAKPKGQPQVPKPIQVEPVDSTLTYPVTADGTNMILQEPSATEELSIAIPFWLMDVVEEVGQTLGKSPSDMVVEALRFHLDLYIPEGIAAREKAHDEEG